MIERVLRRGLAIAQTRRDVERDPNEHLADSWDRLLPTDGLLDFGDERALELIREVFPRFQTEYAAFPASPANASDGGFYLRNGYFESVDAEVLHCMVRHFRPRTVIEVGSGFSTLITRQALAANAQPSRLLAIDPEPRTDILSVIDEHIAAPVERVAPSVFEQLGEHDVLFIDSSHVIQSGGDVNFLVFNVLPKLRRGVLVHIHDIFLPYDYPARWVAAGNTEQYIVLAFLAYNSAFEVLLAAHHMRMRYPREVMAAFPSCTHATHPGSLWLRRVA